MISHILQGLLGLLGFLALAVAMSERRKSIPWKSLGVALVMQFVLALAMLKLPFLRSALSWLSSGVEVIKAASDEGARFMFGYLAGGPTPYELANPDANFVVAFQVLPLILVVSALSSVLFHVGVLPRIIGLFSIALRKVFALSGVLGFSAAASIFMGIIESPLLVKPYLLKLSRSELFALIVCGMSTVAGSVMVLYAQVVGSVIEDAMGHILVASVISVPAALALAQTIIPPEPRQEGDEEDADVFTFERDTHTVVDALLKGIQEGLTMVLQIAAVIIVLFACVYLVNAILGLLPSWADEPLSIQLLVGSMLRPIMWMAGIPWAETAVAAKLMATKTILNEFVAYLGLARLPEGTLSRRSELIMTYAMCGFANLGSLGILAGGMGALVPERRTELVGLSAKALIAGTLATLMTGTIIGILHP